MRSQISSNQLHFRLSQDWRLPERNPWEHYKLKDLVFAVLSKDIQGHGLQAHDSIEDAWAALQLYIFDGPQFVQHKR